MTWSYLELFGRERVARAVFVEQTPRQYVPSDWPWYHRQCFDDAALATVQAQLACDPTGFDRENLAAVLRTELDDEERDLLLAEMAKCPPEVRGAIMADHTRHDWRDLLPCLALPALVLVARQDAVFPWQGAAHVGELIPGAQTVVFEHSSHMLFRRMPALAGPEEPPARLHGDLWAGNVLSDALIDPAAHGGHREADLAMLRLFGAPSERCFAAYAEVAPLADGHEERVGLWQLQPLLVHAILFGGGYGAAAARVAQRLAA